MDINDMPKETKSLYRFYIRRIKGDILDMDFPKLTPVMLLWNKMVELAKRNV
jgi:hypothetical protein